MTRFWIVISFYLAIYGVMTWYVLSFTARIFSLRGWGVLVLSLWGAFMVACPLILRLGEKIGGSILRHALAWVGYVWMGFIFLSFCGLLGLILLRLILWFARYPLSDWGIRWIGIGIIFLSIGTCWWAYREALDIHPRHIVIESDKLPPEWPVLKIVHISDIHLGLLVREKRLSKIIDLAIGEDPHVVVSTGDIVDGQMNGRVGDIEIFHRLSPPLGKFGVIGNHEVYAGLKQSVAFTEEAGFRLLRNEWVDVGPVILVGVNDPAVSMVEEGHATVYKLLAEIPRDKFCVLLKHQPLVREETLGFYDLQLSGHVHGGQIWPFNLITTLIYPMTSGLHELPRGNMLVVTTGAGTWGPPMRLFATPEITVIHIQKK